MRATLLLAAALAGACSPPDGAGVTSPAGVRVLTALLDAGPLLRQPARTARAAGAGVLQPIGMRLLGEGSQLGSFVELSAKDCLLAVARAGQGVRDADLFVFDDAGDRLVSDEAPDANAAALLCPPHPRRVYVAARLVGGVGMLALGVARTPPARAPAVAKALAARGLPRDDTGELAAWPGLDRAVRERRRALGGGWRDIRRVAVPLDMRAYTPLSLELPANHCLDVLVTPSEEIAALDAIVRDEAGRVVARTRTPGRDRSFVLCSQLDTRLSLMMRPRGSSGSAAVVVSRSEPGVADQLDGRTWVDAATAILPAAQAIARWHRRLAASGIAGGAVRATTASLHTGHLLRTPRRLGAGCTRIDLIGGRPLGHFTAELWSEDDVRVARADGTEHAALFRCGVAASFTLELRAVERSGPLRVERRRIDKAAPALTAHPDAAAALLARIDARRGPIAATAAAAARALALAAGARTRWSLAVPAGHCIDVLAAVGRGGRGLALLLEAQDGAIEERRGTRSVAITACGGRAGAHYRLSLSLDLGRADALVLERAVPQRATRAANPREPGAGR